MSKDLFMWIVWAIPSFGLFLCGAYLEKERYTIKELILVLFIVVVGGPIVATFLSSFLIYSFYKVSPKKQKISNFLNKYIIDFSNEDDEKINEN